MAPKTSTFFDLKTCLRSKAPHSSVNGRGLEVDGVLCHVRIPMENAVARAVMRVVAHVMVKSGLLDFCGLILIVSVFNVVVFEAMEMWVMGCHLGEVGIGGAPERLWENEAERNAASGVSPSAWCTVDGERGWESGRGEDAKRLWTSGTVGRDVAKGWNCRRARPTSWANSQGKRAVVLFKNPTDLRASRSKRASLVGSPPVPDRSCSLSPVKICKQWIDKNPARTVKPAWPPCWALSLIATPQDWMKDCNSGWSLQRSRKKEPWVTKMHRLGESALKEA